MPANVLLIAIDGLRASALGAYGNTSIPTPALDSFAAESFLLDSCFAPSPDLNEIYRALWHSQPPTPHPSSVGRKAVFESSTSLPHLFHHHGYATSLITDEHSVIPPAKAVGFNSITHVNETNARSVATPSDDPLNTNLARLFAAATNEAVTLHHNGPRLVWLHARGMYGAWDAPLELQQSLLDEGDPPPVESTTPPDLLLKPRDDPDEVFRYTCAYAAQVMILDACWESFLDKITAAVNGPWLVTLIGARGFPLGEHHRIGGVDPRLYSDQLHVPWLIRFPDNSGRLARNNQLTSHLDLLPTLIDWLGDATKPGSPFLTGSSILPLASAPTSTWRDALFSTSTTARAIRTTNWCLRENIGAGSASSLPELYVRPDDRCEANDIAKLCPDVVEELHARTTEPPNASVEIAAKIHVENIARPFWPV